MSPKRSFVQLTDQQAQGKEGVTPPRNDGPVAWPRELIDPMLSTLVATPFDDPGFLFEVK